MSFEFNAFDEVQGLSEFTISDDFDSLFDQKQADDATNNRTTSEKSSSVPSSETDGKKAPRRRSLLNMSSFSKRNLDPDDDASNSLLGGGDTGTPAEKAPRRNSLMHSASARLSLSSIGTTEENDNSNHTSNSRHSLIRAASARLLGSNSDTDNASVNSQHKRALIRNGSFLNRTPSLQKLEDDDDLDEMVGGIEPSQTKPNDVTPDESNASDHPKQRRPSDGMRKIQSSRHVGRSAGGRRKTSKRSKSSRTLNSESEDATSDDGAVKRKKEKGSRSSGKNGEKRALRRESSRRASNSSGYSTAESGESGEETPSETITRKHSRKIKKKSKEDLASESANEQTTHVTSNENQDGTDKTTGDSKTKKKSSRRRSIDYLQFDPTSTNGVITATTLTKGKKKSDQHVAKEESSDQDIEGEQQKEKKKKVRQPSSGRPRPGLTRALSTKEKSLSRGGMVKAQSNKASAFISTRNLRGGRGKKYGQMMEDDAPLAPPAGESETVETQNRHESAGNDDGQELDQFLKDFRESKDKKGSTSRRKTLS